MTPLGVHHVSVNVDDVEAACAFYTGVLGLTPRSDRPDFGVGGAWLDAGPHQLHLVEGPPADDRGQHFAVLVADIDATVSELRAAGTDVCDPFAVGDAGARQAFLHDPAGNLVEIHQPA